VIADYFGVPAGGPRPIPLSSFMPELAPLWKEMAAKYGLAQPELGSLVNWGFLYSSRRASIGSIKAARRAGYMPNRMPTPTEMPNARTTDCGVIIVF
jgi:hypothetical protein